MLIINFQNPTVEILGEQYEAEWGKIDEVTLGFEDHGMFTYLLVFSFSGSGQAFGMRTGFDIEEIKNLITFFEVGSWEKIKGKGTYALRSERYGLIDGLLSLDQQRAFFPGKPIVKQFD